MPFDSFSYLAYGYADPSADGSSASDAAFGAASYGFAAYGSGDAGNPAPVAGVNDNTILDDIAYRLGTTGQFARAYRGGLPEGDPAAAAAATLAIVEPYQWQEANYNTGSRRRTVTYYLHLVARDPSAARRDRMLASLEAYAHNVLDDVKLAGVTLRGLTGLSQGEYLDPTGEERRMRVQGTFVYVVPRDAHATD